MVVVPLFATKAVPGSHRAQGTPVMGRTAELPFAATETMAVCALPPLVNFKVTLSAFAPGEMMTFDQVKGVLGLDEVLGLRDRLERP